ncbi:MAG: ABC transporter ATP-binding protein [Bacteroidota bacterium]
MTTSPLILDGLTVGYGKKAVLAELNARVEPCGFVCVLGRNGSGKTTLLRTIAGLQTALAGEVCLGDDGIGPMPTAERARRVAVVLTEQAHSPGLTVDDVVALGRQPFTDWRGALSPEDRGHIREAFDLAGAAPFAGRLFDDLSDGERQRVMIARAVAQRPALMVLDEITAFLDLPGRVEVMSLLRRHARETGTVVLLSSHDLDLSLQLADAVWLLTDGSLQVGSPNELISQGTVGLAFDTADVAFSAERGRFELRRESPTSRLGELRD